MKKSIFFLIAALWSAATIAQSGTPIAIIPQPVVMVPGNGQFVLPANPVITVSKGQEWLAGWLQQAIQRPSGKKLALTQLPAKGHFRISLNPSKDPQIGREGYRLRVNAEGVALSANEPAGLFYGLQTLIQLLPREIMRPAPGAPVQWSIPFIDITDYPRFGWRGLMLDVARHFYTIDQVKVFIDQMAQYKYNLLHLHLSDDEGWRVEIKSLPELTRVGAWNVAKMGGNFGQFSAPDPDEPRNNGGFYTQEQLKDLVAYAKERFIDILPEIDVPGHSMAAVASYPELSGTPGKKQVLSGEQFVIWGGAGEHGPRLLVDNTLSPSNEKTYEFLDKVFTEIAAIFPFEYIHMGGDECIKTFWKENEDIKALMQKEHLKDMEEVQSYFVHRVEKIILSKGKKMIGWDEILQGGLAPNAAVMSWRGFEGGTEAAKQGHEVVMSPYMHVYLDLMQGDSAIEAPVYATVRLQDSYAFEPVPAGVDPQYIKGGQANIWTEKIYNTRHLQYMLWPRGFAVAEVLWSPKETRNWDNFISRVEVHFRRFDEARIKYATSMYEPIVTVRRNDNRQLVVVLKTEVSGVTLHYSFDSSYPDEFYPAYTQPLTLPKDISFLRVVGYKNGRKVGRTMSIPVSSLIQRADGK